MRAIDYALRQGWLGLRRERAASTLAILAIALAMIVLGVLLLLTWNAERVVAQWTTAAELSIYLRDDATSEQRGAIEMFLDRSGVVATLEYVSKPQALARFRREFSELASLTTGTTDNPFPASLEVRPRPDAERDGRVEDVVRRAAALPGVADVRYDHEWLARVATGVRTIRRAGMALVLLMALAAALTVAAVVRLGLQSRRDEIAIMTLVGSPVSFIRGPFVAEGLLQGGIGAVLALALLWIAFATGTALWGHAVRAAFDGGALAFLPVHLCVSLVLGGLAVGSVGGLAAARHAI